MGNEKSNEKVYARVAFCGLALFYAFIAIFPLFWPDLDATQNANLNFVNLSVTIAAGLIAFCETCIKLVTLRYLRGKVEKPKTEKRVACIKIIEIVLAILTIGGTFCCLIIKVPTLDEIDLLADFLTLFPFACFFFNVILDGKIEEQIAPKTDTPFEIYHT